MSCAESLSGVIIISIALLLAAAVPPIPFTNPEALQIVLGTTLSQAQMDKEGAAAAAAAADAPAAAEMAPPAAAAPVAMKQRKNRGNLRKRATDDDAAAAEADDDKTAVVRKAKQQRGEPLAFSTKKEGPQDVAVTFASTAAALAARDESATKTLETETEFDRDSR